MSTLPHPLTLEDRMLARNRWQARRALWPQTSFIVAMYAALAAVVLLLWSRVDAHWIETGATWIRAHESMLAFAMIIAATMWVRAMLRRDALRHADSAHAAAPVWRDMQRRRDAHTRLGLAVRVVLAGVLWIGLIAVHDTIAAGRMAASLRWSVLAALLAIVFVPAPTGIVSARTSQSPRLARVPRWLATLGTTDLPHLPQWWWQRAGAAWMRGRAGAWLAAGLLLAPTDAVAIVLPITLLVLGALIHALDAAHRLSEEIARLLATRPPSARRIWRALWPLHASLTIGLLLLTGLLLHALSIAVFWIAVIALMLAVIANIDLLLAIVLRNPPQRLGIARMQVLVAAIAVASAMPPLLPLCALGLLGVLLQRVWRDDAHA